MAQTSAAREPTMEEILASIRRIIESNDVGGPDEIAPKPQLTSVDGGRVEPDAPTGRPSMTAESEEASVTAVPARSVALGTLTVSARDERSENDPAPGKAISLADVAARLRGTSSQPESAAPAVRTAPPQQEMLEAVPAERAAEHDETPVELASAVKENGSSRSEPFEEELEIAEEVAISLAEELAEFEALGDDDQAESLSPIIRQPGSERAMAQPIVAEVSRSRASGALISQAAGAKVAAAFGDLDEAIARGQMRSFDEIAQEMLAPMLRDWLDDNLPTLVERLVREEIERVARGGRR
jgi:uncharacterized protein